jgi:hypothetical protein
MILTLVCLFALLEVTSAPLAFSTPWYMAQGAMAVGATFAVIRRRSPGASGETGEFRRPTQRRPLEPPQVKRAA